MTNRAGSFIVGLLLSRISGIKLLPSRGRKMNVVCLCDTQLGTSQQKSSNETHLLTWPHLHVGKVFSGYLGLQ